MKIEQVKMDKADLEIARQRFVQEKTALQSELAEINSSCRVTLPMKEFQKIQSRRGQIVRQVNDIEAEISNLNIQLKQVNTVVSIKTQKNELRINMVREIVKLRDEYHAKSMDDGHSPELRRTFWKFSQEIKYILTLNFLEYSEIFSFNNGWFGVVVPIRKSFPSL